MKNFTILVWLVVLLLANDHAFAAEAPAGCQSKPNIIFILVDDMGYSDIGVAIMDTNAIITMVIVDIVAYRV